MKREEAYRLAMRACEETWNEKTCKQIREALDQEPKTGRWIYGEDNPGTGRDGWFCNQCGHFEFWDYSLDMRSAKLNLPRICPTCFAKMQEVEE